MIYIIDNGQAYSDHEIMFIESDFTTKQMEAFLETTNHYLIGATQTINWWNGGTTKLSESFSIYDIKIDKTYNKEQIEALVVFVETYNNTTPRYKELLQILLKQANNNQKSRIMALILGNNTNARSI